MNQPDDSLTMHDDVARQLPWLINGTLAPQAAAQVREHLTQCARCRADYQRQQRLHAAMNAEDSLVFAAEPSFQKLLTRLRAGEAARAPPPAADSAPRTARRAWRSSPAVSRAARGAPRGQHPAPVRWLTAAVVIQALGLGFAGWSWYHAGVHAEAPYTTLTAPAPRRADTGRARVYFQPQTSVQELGQLLRGVRAHVIDGPSEANVYTLGFVMTGAARSEDLPARLAALRASPAVVLAEPLPADAP